MPLGIDTKMFKIMCKIISLRHTNDFHLYYNMIRFSSFHWCCLWDKTLPIWNKAFTFKLQKIKIFQLCSASPGKDSALREDLAPQSSFSPSPSSQSPQGFVIFLAFNHHWLAAFQHVLCPAGTGGLWVAGGLLYHETVCHRWKSNQIHHWQWIIIPKCQPVHNHIGELQQASVESSLPWRLSTATTATGWW